MKRTIVSVTLIICCIFLFARLGHNALWDDESYTALAGIGVWQTGDTSALIDNNLVAFRGGELLKNLRDRSTPPLPAYLDAPFVGIGGRSALAARLPFALCGAALIALAFWRLLRLNTDTAGWLLAAATLISCVPFFLYFRQCRYYGVVMLATAMLADAYLRAHSRRRVIAILACSLVLLGANYISLIAAGICIGADYLFWGRKDHAFTLKELSIIFVPMLVIGIPIVWIWNPLGLDPVHYRSDHPLHDRLLILWWYFRDVCRGEFAAVGLLLVGTGVCWWLNDQLLRRGLIAIALYVAIIAVLSPQSVLITKDADIRYAAAIIPIALAVQWRVLKRILEINPIAAWVLAALALATNALTLAPIFGQPFRCTPFEYAHELLNPPPEPYTATVQWISANMHRGQSVWVVPEHMAYPLMFHAPQIFYAWQLNSPPAGQFKDLPLFHFKEIEPPDYLIAFGTVVYQLLKYPLPPDMHYELEPPINVAGYDQYRPELFWHSFKAVSPDVDKGQAIYIFKRKLN